MARLSGHVILATVLLFLVCSDAQLDWVGTTYGLVKTARKTLQQHDHIVKVIDNVASKRVERGNDPGAARIKLLKNWFGIIGYRRSLPLLIVDGLIKQEKVLEVNAIALSVAAKLGQEVKDKGIGAALENNMEYLNATTYELVSTLSTNFQRGALRQLWDDILTEMGDVHTVEDVLGSVYPAQNVSGVSSLLNDMFNQTRHYAYDVKERMRWANWEAENFGLNDAAEL